MMEDVIVIGYQKVMWVAVSLLLIFLWLFITHLVKLFHFKHLDNPGHWAKIENNFNLFITFIAFIGLYLVIQFYLI